MSAEFEAGKSNGTVSYMWGGEDYRGLKVDPKYLTMTSTDPLKAYDAVHVFKIIIRMYIRYGMLSSILAIFIEAVKEYKDES